MRRAGITPVVLVRLDLDGTPTSVKYVSGDSPLLGYQPGISSIQPMSAQVDPITRRVQAGDITITFKDSKAIRNIIKTYPLKGHRVKVYLGCSELTTESDWYQVFGGAVDEVIPTPGLTSHTMRVADAFGLVLDKEITFQVASRHPMRVILDFLQDVGAFDLEPELIDAASFDPENVAAAADIGHWLVSRFNFPEGDERAQITPFSGLRAIEELAILCNGGIVPTNEGKLRFARYSHSTATVRTWDKSMIRGLRQKEATKTLINHATMQFGWTGGGDPLTVEGGTLWAPHESNGEAEFRYAVDLKDSDSIARYVFGSASAAQFYKKFSTKWFGFRSHLNGAITSGGTAVIAHASYFRAFCGTNTTDTNSTVSAARPVYLRIDDEIIKCDVLAMDSATESIPPDEDLDGNPTGNTPDDGLTAMSQGVYNAGSLSSTAGGGQVGGGAEVWGGTFTVAASGRGAAGTVAAAHADGAEILDVTIAVQHLNDLIGRCSDGLSIIEADLPVWENTPDYGDNVALTHDAYLAYGVETLAGTEKWEVIGKTLHAIGVEPHYTYLLASVRTPPSVTKTYTWPDYRLGGNDYGPANSGGRLYWLLRNKDFLQSYVLDTGFTVSNPSGRNIQISSGTVNHFGFTRRSAGRTTDFLLGASRDHYIFWNADRGVFLRKDVATGGAAPSTPPSALFLSKCVVGAASISSTSNPVERKPIVGSKLKEGSGPLTKLDANGLLDNLTSITTRVIDSLTDGTYARTLAAALSAGKVNLAAGSAGLAGQLPEAQLGDLAVTTAKLAAAAVTTAKIGALQVTSAEIAAAAITDAKVAAGAAIAGSKMSSAFALPGSLSVATTATISGAATLNGAVEATAGFAVTKPNVDGMPYASVTDRETTNHVKNPSFEVNTTGWEAYASAGDVPTISRVTTQGLFGSATPASLFVDSNDANGGVAIGAKMTAAYAAVAAAGETWCGSAHVRTNDRLTVTIVVEFLDGNNADAITGSAQEQFTIPANTWVRIQEFMVAPANSTKAILYVYVINSTGPFDLFIDGVQLEKGGQFPSSYCDGSMGAGYAWTGSANDSTSTRTGGTRDLGGMAAGSSPVIAWDDGGLEAKILRTGGSSFPSSPSTNDVFFRTDQGLLYFYDGTRWLSVEEYAIPLGAYSKLPATLSTATETVIQMARCPTNAGAQIYVTRWSSAVWISATNSGSHYWNIGIGNTAGTNFASYNTNAMSASSGWNNNDVTVNQVRTPSTDKNWSVNVTKTGSPSGINTLNTIHYRIIG